MEELNDIPHPQDTNWLAPCVDPYSDVRLAMILQQLQFCTVNNPGYQTSNIW